MRGQPRHCCPHGCTTSAFAAAALSSRASSAVQRISSTLRALTPFLLHTMSRWVTLPSAHRTYLSLGSDCCVMAVPTSQAVPVHFTALIGLP